MIQSIHLFRRNCVWKTFPCRNKTSIDNTNSQPLKAFLRYTHGSNSGKKLLAEDGSRTPQETKLRFFVCFFFRPHRCCRPTNMMPCCFFYLYEQSSQCLSSMCQTYRQIVCSVFESSIKKADLCYSLSLNVIHYSTPLSLNVYHQFANEPIKEHETH